MDRGDCKSCGAAIRWGVTLKGARIPLDPDPVPDGNLVVRDNVVVYLTADERDALDSGLLSSPAPARYKSHFATCPNAASHRKKGGPS